MKAQAFVSSGTTMLTAGGLCLALSIGGCGSKKGDGGEGDSSSEAVEDLTIVVEADRSRIQQEEQELQRKRESFDSERRRIDKERQEIADRIASLSSKDKKARDKLEAEQRRIADEDKRVRERAESFESDRVKLDDQKSKLLERIAKMTATKDGLSIEQREHAIAKRELDVAKREAELAQREAKIAERDSETAAKLQEAAKLILDLQSSGSLTKTVFVQPPTGASPAASSANKASVDKLRREVRTAMEAKGILLEDLTQNVRDSWNAGNKAIEDKDFASATDSFSEVNRAVAITQVNAEFVKAKMQRINRELANKTPDEQSRNQIRALLNDVGEAINDGRYDRANKKTNQLNQIVVTLK